MTQTRPHSHVAGEILGLDLGMAPTWGRYKFWSCAHMVLQNPGMRSFGLNVFSEGFSETNTVIWIELGQGKGILEIIWWCMWTFKHLSIGPQTKGFAFVLKRAHRGGARRFLIIQSFPATLWRRIKRSLQIMGQKTEQPPLSFHAAFIWSDGWVFLSVFYFRLFRRRASKTAHSFK